jgi:hypothetical protein
MYAGRYSTTAAASYSSEFKVEQHSFYRQSRVRYLIVTQLSGRTFGHAMVIVIPRSLHKNN